MIREPWVAGRWYPSEPDKLRVDLERYCAGAPNARELRAVIAPHAGFMFSGRTAGQVFAQTRVPPLVVMLGPKHTRDGAPYAILPRGRWRTPLGDVEVDSEACAELMAAVGLLSESVAAHAREHALEAHVPFLQHVAGGDFRIVPVVMAGMSYADCEVFGGALAELIRVRSEPVLIAASTDMSHFETAEDARRLDMMAIARMQERDARGLYEVVFERDISMCGVIPTVITLIAVNLLGATRAELVEYTHSGEITGDHSRVVGYAGLTVE